MIGELSEKENELVLRALREYSESCRAPALIPECPFAIEIGQNERGCGEECMDLLGKHEARRPHRLIQVRPGLNISRPIRPRPRRSGDLEGRPFDAKEIYLQDHENRTPQQWRLPAILYAIKQTIQSLPDDSVSEGERYAYVVSLLDALAQFGIDTSTLAEPWIREHTRRAVLGRVYAHWSVRRTFQTSIIVESWVQLLDDAVSRDVTHCDASARPDSDVADAALISLMNATGSWSRSASLAQVVEWSPPGALEISNREHMDDLSSDARWLFDRFTETYLEQ